MGKGPDMALDEAIKHCDSENRALDDYYKHCIAGKIIAGKKLSKVLREKAYELITGHKYTAPPKKKRGRPKAPTDKTLEMYQLYIDLRPQHKNDIDTFREIHSRLNMPDAFEDCYLNIWHAINDNREACEEIDRLFWKEFEECWGISERIKEQKIKQNYPENK